MDGGGGVLKSTEKMLTLSSPFIQSGKYRTRRIRSKVKISKKYCSLLNFKTQQIKHEKYKDIASTAEIKEKVGKTKKIKKDKDEDKHYVVLQFREKYA